MDLGFDADLVRLTLGQVSAAELLGRTKEGLLRAQVHCYAGCRDLTLGHAGEAVVHFDKALELSDRFLERPLALAERQQAVGG